MSPGCSSPVGASHLVSVGSTRTLSYTLYLTPLLARDSRTAFIGGSRDRFLSVIRHTFWAPRFCRSCRRTGEQPQSAQCDRTEPLPSSSPQITPDCQKATCRLSVTPGTCDHLTLCNKDDVINIKPF